jgi:hypothetical protein
MITPARFRESLAAVCLVGTRLHFNPNPVDWIVLIGLSWAILPLCEQPRHRQIVLGATVAALSALYLRGQIIHMMADAYLLR